MKKFDKEIWIGNIGILITNYLSLGFSIKKYSNEYFHINLFTCQIAFTK